MRRPAQISPEEEAKRWEEVFGKREPEPKPRYVELRKRCPDQWNKGSTRAYLGLP